MSRIKNCVTNLRMKISFVSQIPYLFSLFAFEVSVFLLLGYYEFHAVSFFESCQSKSCASLWLAGAISGTVLVVLVHGFVQVAAKVISLQYSVAGKAPDLVTVLQLTLNKYGEGVKIEMIGSMIQSILFLVASCYWFAAANTHEKMPLASAIIFGFSLAWIFWAHFFFLSLRRRATIVELLTNKPWFESYRLGLLSLFSSPDSFSWRAILLSICTVIVWISLLIAVIVVPPFFFIALCMVFFLESIFRSYHYWFQVPLVTSFLQYHEDDTWQ